MSKNLPSIEAVRLSKSYGPFEALSLLNLRVEGAKCVGFLGPNGAGKTTTLKIFCDMIRASEGQAYLNGVEIQENKKKALEYCGVLVESPEIYPSLTAGEALSMFAELKGIPKVERRKNIEEAAAQVKMEEWMGRKFGKLSKGMKQRINIAAALLGDPDILLLDEPTNGLDPRGMAEVRELLKAIKQKKKLIFMSSHLLNEVADVCDEVAMINRGKLLVYDTIQNATARFSAGSAAFEVGFARAVDFGEAKQNLKGVVDSLEALDSRNFRLKFSGGIEAQEKLVALLASWNSGLISFKSSSSALEGTYLSLVSKSEG